jgi:hypothetical protein
MLTALILTSLVLGTALAGAASRVPSHAVALERWGGTLLVGGLVLLGAVLPLHS